MKICRRDVISEAPVSAANLYDWKIVMIEKSCKVDT